MPLIVEREALGTLNLASRGAAFPQRIFTTLQPLADALAVAHGKRRLANALARQKMANELSELTFAFANDMRGAVQAIIGQCELLAVKTRAPEIEQEFTGMLHQAKRLRDILDNMQRMIREHVATNAQPDK